jgi:hypothetical protein
VLALALDNALNDNCSAWDLDANGQYRLRAPAEGELKRCFQTVRHHCKANHKAHQGHEV